MVILEAVIRTAAYGESSSSLDVSFQDLALVSTPRSFLSGKGTLHLSLRTHSNSVSRQVETLPAETRERFGIIQYLILCCGATISFWMNYALSYTGGQFEWRFAVAAQIIFAIFLICLVPFMPGSLRWLMMYNFLTESLTILQRMHGVTDPMITRCRQKSNLSTKPLSWSQCLASTDGLKYSR